VGAFKLLVYGYNFTSSSVVQWSGSTLPTTYIGPTELSASVPGSFVAFPGVQTATITVVNGSQNSNGYALKVISPTVTFASELLTQTAPPADGSCGSPVPGSSFATAATLIYLYFTGTVTNADSLYNDWVGPDGSVIAGGYWGSGSGNYCFTGASLEIDGTPPSRLGPWQARVFDNGILVFWVPFTITP
jgi:hypothetical protein